MDEKPTPELVPGSANVRVIREEYVERIDMHRLHVPGYEVTEHQLKLIESTAKDAGLHFNIFTVCASVAVTIILALSTTEIKDQRVATWWHGGFVGFAIVTVVFFIFWLRSRNLFNDTLEDIRSQKSNPTKCDPRN